MEEQPQPQNQPQPSASNPFSPQARGADDEERDLWRGGFSPKAMLGKWVFSGFVTIAGLVVVLIFASDNSMAWLGLGVGVLVVWGYFLLQLAYRRLGITYRLTTQRLFHEQGILSREIDRIEVIDMDDITFSQGVFDRVMGVGKIKVSSSDRTHPELYLYGIENVREVADMMDKARRQERLRRGIHIEAV